jgi:hypothetical protein
VGGSRRALRMRLPLPILRRRGRPPVGPRARPAFRPPTAALGSSPRPAWRWSGGFSSSRPTASVRAGGTSSASEDGPSPAGPAAVVAGRTATPAAPAGGALRREEGAPGEGAGGGAAFSLAVGLVAPPGPAAPPGLNPPGLTPRPRAGQAITAAAGIPSDHPASPPDRPGWRRWPSCCCCRDRSAHRTPWPSWSPCRPRLSSR